MPRVKGAGMKQLKVKIIENKRIAQSFYKMRIESPYLAKNSKPGQFVEVKCADKNGPLLRRPLGVHKISENSIELLYGIVGKGTEMLSERKAGELLDVIGSLGNGFDLQQSAVHGPRSTVLVGGGVGVAPLVALAQKLGKKKSEVIVIIGAKTKSHILCEREFKNAGCLVKVSTEDGSKGLKGYATDILRHLLTIVDCRKVNIYACGPHPMLKAVAHIADAVNIPCQVSLEERMACGVGVCLGCPVKVRTAYSVGRRASTPNTQRPTQYEYKMVCKDGPVFDAKEIAW